VPTPLEELLSWFEVGDGEVEEEVVEPEGGSVAVTVCVDVFPVTVSGAVVGVVWLVAWVADVEVAVDEVDDVDVVDDVVDVAEVVLDVEVEIVDDVEEVVELVVDVVDVPVGSNGARGSNPPVVCLGTRPALRARNPSTWPDVARMMQTSRRRRRGRCKGLTILNLKTW